MAVALVQSAKYQTNTTATSSGTVSLSAPTSGNYLVGYIACWGTPNSILPAGFTQLDQLSSTAGGDVSLRTFYKVSNGAETSTTVAMNTSDYFSAAIMEFSGVAAVESHNTNKVSAGTPTTLANTTLTPANLNDMVLSIICGNVGVVGSAGLALTVPAGYTRQQHALSDYNASAIATKNALTTDTTTAQGTTWTTSFGEDMVASLILLRPTAAATTATISTALMMGV